MLGPQALFRGVGPAHDHPDRAGVPRAFAVLLGVVADVHERGHGRAEVAGRLREGPGVGFGAPGLRRQEDAIEKVRQAFVREDGMHAGVGIGERGDLDAEEAYRRERGDGGGGYAPSGTSAEGFPAVAEDDVELGGRQGGAEAAQHHLAPEGLGLGLAGGALETEGKGGVQVGRGDLDSMPTGAGGVDRPDRGMGEQQGAGEVDGDGLDDRHDQRYRGWKGEGWAV